MSQQQKNKTAPQQGGGGFDQSKSSLEAGKSLARLHGSV